MPLYGAKKRFGPFELDSRTGELRTNGTRIKLQGQPISVLEILLETPGELVTREQIRERLWSSDTFVDFDHNLNTAIKKLRQALGDEAETPRYIETIPRYGYRFIGQVELDAAPGAATTPSEPTGTEPARRDLEKDSRPRRALPWALGGIAV
ncbi:MAG: winged helix-turn-helix domain-containing protein, partial [Terracidiphilus sp.]